MYACLLPVCPHLSPGFRRILLGFVDFGSRCELLVSDANLGCFQEPVIRQCVRVGRSDMDISWSRILITCSRISVTIVISFAARGLSSIRSQIFCYTAISSASIIGILPGYLIRESNCNSYDNETKHVSIVSSSLELASKNIVCGSVKMVYALIYTLFLVRCLYTKILAFADDSS